MNGRMPPIETDPLGAIRSELIAAAWRRKAVRDRRRRAATVMSTTLATLVCAVAGATALGIDVPVIGDALDRVGANRQDNEQASQGPGGDPTFRVGVGDVKPGAGSIGEPVRFDAGDGAALAAPYVNTRDQLCVGYTYPDDEVNQGGCDLPSAVAERLQQAAIDPFGVEVRPSAVVLSGYVSSEVERVTASGPVDQLDVRVSAPWRADVPGAPELRLFVAIARGERSRSDALSVLGRYRISARLSDGRTVTVHR